MTAQTAPNQPVAVSYGPVSAQSAEFQHAVVTSRSVDEVVQRLRDGIAAADLWVLHEIDPKMVLGRGGFAIQEGRQILFFHPRLLARMLEIDPAALVEAPIKFVVMQMGLGETTIRWIDPTTPFARYGNAEIAKLGRDLSATCRALAETAAA
jgi:uncharacterized protein (DUF302 family)